jgi:glucan phosphoethanolaminetransferase (alkaline phosphatase superfamily)
MTNLKILTRYFKLSIFFIFLFFFINFIHFQFFYPKVILYSLILDIIITVLIILIILFLFNRSFYFSKNLLLTFFFIFAITQSLIVYSLVIPTVVDRSLSIYLLNYLKNNKPLKMSELTKIAQDNYIVDMQVIETRVNEQLATGSIIVNNDEITLTNKGKKLLLIFSFVKKYLLPKKI